MRTPASITHREIPTSHVAAARHGHVSARPTATRVEVLPAAHAVAEHHTIQPSFDLPAPTEESTYRVPEQETATYRKIASRSADKHHAEAASESDASADSAPEPGGEAIVSRDAGEQAKPQPGFSNQVAYEAVPQEVPSGPLVAEQIDLDPSISETPSLPTRAPRSTELPKPSPIVEPRADAPAQPPLHNANFQPSPARSETDSPPAAQPQAPPPQALPPAGPWPTPVALLAQIEQLKQQLPAAAAWAEQVTAQLTRLTHTSSLGAPDAGDAIVELGKLANAAKANSAALATDEERSLLLRTGYALNRRLVIWEQAWEMGSRTPPQTPTADAGQLQECLRGAEAHLRQLGDDGTWRNYLLLDRAADELCNSNCLPSQRCEIARTMLQRMHNSQLTHDQQQLLSDPSLAALIPELRVRAEEPLELTGLLRAVEAYESEDLSANATALADAYQRLRFSIDPASEELGATINAYYRNANVRVAISAELVNRFMPKEKAMIEPVRDQILGAEVSGQSATQTRLRIVLLPDRRRWHLGLEANGAVTSTTASAKGPAVFYQDGLSFFRVRKALQIDRRGVRLFNAEAQANANNQLSDFETSYDGIPLLGGIARSIARSQYDQASSQAQAEVEGRIRGRATSTFDQQVREKIEKAKVDFQAKLLGPLQRLRVDPTPVDLETTQDRLIARYRLAGREQLSANTPRPQAPGDSLLSVQVHQTALNNILENLELQGRTIDLRDFYSEMIKRFNLKSEEIPEELPEGVSVTFADEDPVRVDCRDSQVQLTIRLKELAHGNRRWKNFTVRGYYVPDGQQLDANLVRDGIIELIGPGLGFGDQIALRGIFSRVLSKNRKINLVNNQIAQSPELKDLQVTQFVIHDGWIGVALGPKFPGREGIARRPSDDEAR